MPRVTLPVPAMTGGVSQQPGPLRLPTQCSVSDNAIATVVEGLRKRPHTQQVGTLDASGNPNWAGNVKHDFIDRDAAERYHVIARDKDLKVYDLLQSTAPKTQLTELTILDSTGAQVTPGAGGDLDYLETSDPSNDLQFLTIYDYTLVLNKSKTVAMNAALTAPNFMNQGLFVVRQGNYATKYIAEVEWTNNGTHRVTVTYTTYHSDGRTANGTLRSVNGAENSIQTDAIVAKIAEAFTAPDITLVSGYNEGTIDRASTSGGTNAYLNSTSGFVVGSKNNVIAIDSTVPGRDFKIRTDDSVGSTVLLAIKDEVQLFSDLPTTAPNGLRVKIIGDPETSDLGYWVEFTAQNEDTFGEGTWSESNQPQISYQLDPATLPHLLIRENATTFRWTPLQYDKDPSMAALTVPFWGTRAVGDLTTNPNPSFVGDKIRGMAFWKNRLVLLSGSNVLLSEVGEYFNFFRTTVTQLLDSARLDLGVPSNKVIQLDSAVPMSEQLVLFSREAQFLIRGEGPLTPTSVTVNAVSEYYSKANADPVPVGDSIMAPALRQAGGYSLIQEMRDVSNNRPQFLAQDLTLSVPAFIEGTVTKMAANPSDRMLAVTTDLATNTIYLYTWFINGNDRVQSAWQKILLFGVPTVKHVQFIDQKLYIVVERVDQSSSTEINVELIDLEDSLLDTQSDTVPWLLDRQITHTDCVSRVYSSTTNRTTITLPYQIGIISGDVSENPTRMMAINTTTKQYLTVVTANNNQLVVSGDHTTTNLVIGERYNMTYTFSQPHLQDRNNVPVSTGLLRLTAGNLLFDNAGHFEVVVNDISNPAASRELSRIPYSSIKSGSLIGAPRNFTDGRLKFGNLGRATDVEVSIENNSPLQSTFLALDWEGVYAQRGGRRV